MAKRSRYDIDPQTREIPLAAAPPPPLWETPPEVQQARMTLEAVRTGVESEVQTRMRAIEGTIAARIDAMTHRLRETQTEIARLERETEAIRQSKYDEVLRNLRERVNAL